MSEPATSLQARISRITLRLEEIRKAEQGTAKSEDLIDLKNANDPDGKRLKNIGGEGLDSMPKAGQAVGKDEGSGGDVKKGKALGKEELCASCNGGKMVKGELCKACGGAGKVKKCGEMSRPGMAKAALEPQQTGGQKNTKPVVTAGIKVPGGGVSRAYQHDPPGAHSSDRPVKKDEVPQAKPPSGASTSKPAAAPSAGSPKVGGASPKAATGTLLPKTKVVNNAGVAMSGTVQQMYRQHQMRGMRERFNALRTQAIRESGMGKAELVAGAAHHLNGLNAAIARQDDGAAQDHARMCVVYERLLGLDPAAGTSTEIEAAASGLAKGEPPTSFKPFGRDKVAEDLFKAVLGKLPQSASLPATAPALSLPGVKGVGGKNMRTSGSAGSAPHLPGVKAPQSLDFGQPNGVAPPAMPSIKLPAPGSTGATPMEPKPKGGALAAIRQKVFGPGKTAAVAKPSPDSPGASPKAPAGK